MKHFVTQKYYEIFEPITSIKLMYFANIVCCLGEHMNITKTKAVLFECLHIFFDR